MHETLRKAAINSTRQGKQFAETNSRQALEMAQKLSHQLQSAEARVAELEADVDGYREKVDRAEQWLHRVYTEIEERFLRQGEGLRGAPQRRRA